MFLLKCVCFLTKVKLLYEQQELISMSTFDNVKENLTNKIDELREELNSDNTDRSNHTDRSDNLDSSATESTSQEQDLQEVPDDHTEIVDEVENDDLIVEEPADDRLATDYDLVQNDLDQSQDSGLDDLSEDEEEERRIAEVDDLYQSPDPEEAP